MGAYLLITLTFSCQHDQLVGVYSDRLKNRGLRHGSGQKRGVLGTGQARKKGGLRHGSGQKRGVFTAAHTCTGHICECPPPPGERANSALKFVKTVHRHTMSHDRFNALVLLFVHRDIALDYNKIINMFANRHPRRMLLLDPLMGESS